METELTYSVIPSTNILVSIYQVPGNVLVKDTTVSKS